jgi:hypothetical protein
MAAVRMLCVIAGLAFASAALEARAQAALRGYDGSEGDSGQAALRGYAPPPPSPSSNEGQSSNESQTPDDWPHDADDDRPYYDHSLPSGPYDAPRREASAQQPAYVPPPPSPLDVARANCAALHQRLEAVMRAEMQGGNPAAMKQHAAERAAIYQQEMQTGCQ